MPPDALLDRLRERGWRITPQRRAIAGALVGEHVHRTVEEIHAAAARIVAEVSLATVYNTLNELVSMGEVAEIRIDGGASRFDPNVGRDHHHLVCRSCGLIFDVTPKGVEGLRLTPSQRYGFTVDDVEVVFRGRCSQCAERSG